MELHQAKQHPAKGLGQSGPPPTTNNAQFGPGAFPAPANLATPCNPQLQGGALNGQVMAGVGASPAMMATFNPNCFNSAPPAPCNGTPARNLINTNYTPVSPQALLHQHHIRHHQQLLASPDKPFLQEPAYPTFPSTSTPVAGWPIPSARATQHFSPAGAAPAGLSAASCAVSLQPAENAARAYPTASCLPGSSKPSQLLLGPSLPQSKLGSVIAARGRSKRMHPGQKRPSEDDESNPGQYPSSGGIHCNDNTRLKLARPGNNSENNDFSALVKHRLASYTRTGQACDRCKIRKIRCDAGPDGCHHCKGGGLGCFVTDRVTGRTERRGYLKELENHTRVLDARIRDLEKLLERKGIKVKPCEKTLELSPSHDASKDDSQQPDEASPSETISDEANPSETKPDDGDDGRWERLGTVLFRDISSNPVLNPDLQEALLVSHPAEQDTPNKNNTPDPRQSLPALKQEQSWPNPGVVTMPTSQAAPATAAFVPDTIPAAVPDGLTQSGEAPIQFFSEPNYSQLPFNEQPQNNLNPPTYGPDGSLYFNQID